MRAVALRLSVQIVNVDTGAVKLTSTLPRVESSLSSSVRASLEVQGLVDVPRPATGRLVGLVTALKSWTVPVHPDVGEEM